LGEFVEAECGLGHLLPTKASGTATGMELAMKALAKL
jgi:hypothetical protein